MKHSSASLNDAPGKLYLTGLYVLAEILERRRRQLIGARKLLGCPFVLICTILTASS